MQHGDHADAPTDLDGDRPAPRPSGRARRPLHGGWLLMIAAGLVAAVANYAVLTGDDAGADVLVVAEAAPPGTAVEDLVLDRRTLGVADPAAHRLLTDVAGLGGRVTSAALEAGVLLRSSDLRVPAGDGVAAMSLPIDPSRAVGGLLAPGDRVDVIAGADGDTTAYVVTDVAVVDVLEPGTGLGAGGGYAVTLAVDADQALALAAAVRDGDVDVVRTGRAGGS